MQEIVKIHNALASMKRLQILNWLKEPVSNFPPQIDGDLESDGVCGLLIAQKLKVSQPTTSRHLKILVDVGLVKATKIGQWTFYKRNKARVAEVKRLVNKTI